MRRGTPRREDLTRKKFGRLTVKSFDRIDNGSARWWCRCRCKKNRSLGTLRSVLAYNLKNGTTRSCGCLLVEANRKRKKNAR